MKYILILFLSIGLISCSNQPTCSSIDIKNQVKKIINQENKKEIQNEYYYQNYNSNDIYQFSKDKNLNYDKISEEISEKVKSEGKIYSDSVMNNVNMTLNNIRIIEIRRNLKKCKCAANLIVNDEAYDIEYTAQNTEDGNIYVELSY